MSGMSGLFSKFPYYRAPARARNLLLGLGPDTKFFDGGDRSYLLSGPDPSTYNPSTKFI